MSSTSRANTTNPRDDPDTYLQCEICWKTYGRKDLRDRHRRRCIKNAGRERPSKRKSCDSCAHKKLRCSMARPACCRCLQMGTPCHYPPSALSTKHAVTAVAQKSQEFSSSKTFSSKVLAPGPIPVSLTPRAGDVSPVSGLDLVPEGEAATPTTRQTPNVASFDPPSSFTSVEFIAHPFPESPFPLQSVSTIRPVIWNEDFKLLYDHFSADGLGPRMLLDNPSSGTFTPIPDVPKTALGGMDNLSPVSVTGNSGSTFSQSPPYDESRRPSTDDTVSYPSTPIHNRNSNGSSPLVFGYTFAHKSGSLIPQDVTDLYQEMFQIMREFPSLLLEGQFCSPFVHRTIYDCSLGGMAEPMGIALDYIRAHASSIGSSHDFAHQMINQERGRLVRDFNAYVSDSPEMCLDALHAVCVYQILGLFGDTLLTAPGPHSLHKAGERGCEECTRAAQLHILFPLEDDPPLVQNLRGTSQRPSSE